MATRSIVPIVLTVIIVVLAIATLPGFFQYFYKLGIGHAFGVMADAENPDWNSMTVAQRAPYLAHVKTEGFKCAMLMTFGQHVPGYLFILITIGLLTRSITGTFRVFLRFAFFAVFILGMFCLALRSGYCGQPPLPDSLEPAFILYLVAATFFGIVIGTGKLIQRGMWRRQVPPTVPAA